MRLNVKLSPDQEHQLLETSMVPVTEADEQVLTIETTTAMPAAAPALQLAVPPVVLASSVSGEWHFRHSLPVAGKSSLVSYSTVKAA